MAIKVRERDLKDEDKGEQHLRGWSMRRSALEGCVGLSRRQVQTLNLLPVTLRWSDVPCTSTEFLLCSFPLLTDLSQPSVPGCAEIHQSVVWRAPQHQLFLSVTDKVEEELGFLPH